MGLCGNFRSVVQPGARRHGIAGIHGNPGIRGICKLQILKGRVGFESHPFRQSCPSPKSWRLVRAVAGGLDQQT